MRSSMSTSGSACCGLSLLTCSKQPHSKHLGPHIKSSTAREACALGYGADRDSLASRCPRCQRLQESARMRRDARTCAEACAILSTPFSRRSLLARS